MRRLAKKIAISIPDEIFDAAEAMVRRLGMSRSELYATAVRAFVSNPQRTGGQEALDAVYATEDARLDPIVARLQALSLPLDEW